MNDIFLHALTGWEKYIPETVVDGASLLGEGTIPVAMVILGGSLGSITFSLRGFV
jgi:predicted permease